MSFGVADCLGQIDVVLGAKPNEPSLIVHSRCKHLIGGFQNYRREERGGKFPDAPVGPQHPAEDLMDTLGGVVRDVVPEGRKTTSCERNTRQDCDDGLYSRLTDI